MSVSDRPVRSYLRALRLARPFSLVKLRSRPRNARPPALNPFNNSPPRRLIGRALAHSQAVLLLRRSVLPFGRE